MNLFIGNLSPETTEQQLKEAFSEFGPVKSVKIIIDPQTGLPKGFGFVEMEERRDGYEAIINLDTTYLKGTIISVKEAKNSKQANSTRPGQGRPFQRRPGSGPNVNRQGGYGDRQGSYGDRQNRFSDRGNYNSDRPNYTRRNFNGSGSEGGSGNVNDY